jgi:3-dehydroquinate synthase
MRIINLNLGERSYKIIIGFGIISYLNNYLEELNLNQFQAVVLTNRSILSRHKDYICSGFKKVKLRHYILLPASERAKSWEMLFKVVEKIFGIENKGDVFLAALGGGVVGDLAGFCAAIYKRGIPYIQIPTTLLGMVDSGIGGKTAIDLEFGKNLVGAFYQPRLVFSDLKFLQTLPEKEIKNGISEIVKYGIITDEGIFKFLEKNTSQVLKFNPPHWFELVVRCAEIKARIVEKDEFDNKGLRAILNFGHTVGHALESAMDYIGISHGQAVAVGMIAESIIARRMGMLSLSALNRIINLITSVGILPRLKDVPSSSQVILHLKYDKKARLGKLRFVLPVKIGKVRVIDAPKKKIIKEALQEAIRLCTK